jgi:hypothetical protein
VKRGTENGGPVDASVSHRLLVYRLIQFTLFDIANVACET